MVCGDYTVLYMTIYTVCEIRYWRNSSSQRSHSQRPWRVISRRAKSGLSQAPWLEGWGHQPNFAVERVPQGYGWDWSFRFGTLDLDLAIMRLQHPLRRNSKRRDDFDRVR